jgi:hypothetical protein
MHRHCCRPVYCTNSCTYSKKVLLGMGEFVARNMYGWIKKINKRKNCCILLVIYIVVWRYWFHNLPPNSGSYMQSSGRHTAISDKIKTKDFTSQDSGQSLWFHCCGSFWKDIKPTLMEDTIPVRPRFVAQSPAYLRDSWQCFCLTRPWECHKCNFTYLHLQPNAMQFTS